MTLSDKDCVCWECEEYATGGKHPKDSPNERAYSEKDVKEFIQKLKEDFNSCLDMPQTTKEMANTLNYVIEIIDKLAGDKLI